MTRRHDRTGPTRRELLATATLAGAALATQGVARPQERSAAPASRSGDPQALLEPVRVAELATPALLLDLDAFERNLEKMARHARGHGVGLRPHAKTHKAPIIARRQLEHGALGICVAKVSEAAAMVDGGIDDVLITSPVATPEKYERVVALAERCPKLKLVVDHADSVAVLDALAERAGVRLGVVVGLDTGTRRTGVALGEPALALVREVERARALTFEGLQAYAGHVMHVTGHAERARRSRETLARCLETRRLVESHGIEVGIFSCGGTGTFDVDCDLEGVTDLQVGSYCFMDVQYRQIGDADGEVFDVFEPSLFVLATAISQPVPDRITVDAGYKAFANEPEAKPEFADLDGLVYHYGGDEHGIVQYLDERRALVRGQKARLLVSHCDPTVNLYDHYHPYRGDGLGGIVREVWPITARGRSQ